MRHKKVVGTLLGLSFVGFVIGVIFTEPEIFGTCRDQYVYRYGEEGNTNNPPSVGCMDPLGDNLGQPLGMISLLLVIIFLTLFFLPHRYFRAWLKYAAWFLVVAIIWIALTPARCGGGFGLSVCMDKELVIWWSCGILASLSILTLIITALNPVPSRVDNKKLRQKKR